MSLRLKSLELIGYKTFAKKTLFEFDSGITAVVGPNGSGKSNIADSLRWVLGEQSFGLLRGRKTDDMIFAGSEKKARASMASAKVTFDNSDGWLPIDFSEVTITRRAYRDGKNEYLINDQKVRLRDVTELLSKSGLAERTYTIIGQGLVDTALTLKSEERRRLFEEAAGIGLYRQRKQQTLRRLDTTRRNLDRVKDILAELAPRLKSLERQARRSDEYHLIRTDLEENLKEWYGYHWHRTQNELLDAKKTQKQQESILETARRDQEKADQTLAELRNQVNTLRSQLSDWHHQLAQLHLQRESAARELAVQGERQRSLNEQKYDLESQITQIEEEFNAQSDLTSQAQTKVDEIAAQIEETQQVLDDIQAALKTKRSAWAEAENALEAKQQELAEIKTRQTEYKAHKKQLETQLVRLEENTAEVTGLAEQTAQALADAKERQADAQERRQEAEQTAAGVLKSSGENEGQLSELEEERKSIQNEYQTQEKTYTQHQVELEVLAQSEAKLAGFVEGAKALIEAGKENSAVGLLGTFNEKIDVPETYETAIAAALGDFLDAVLLNDSQQLEEVLTLLEDQAVQAALLPLKALKPKAALQIKADDNCFGLAADLVSAPADLIPAVDLLLGQVLVVKDRRAAQRGLDKYPGATQAVTLKGVVFSREGSVLVNTGAGAEIFNRKRRKKELAESLDNSEKLLTTLNGQFFEIDEREIQLRAKNAQIAQELDDARQNETSTRDTLHAVNLEVEQVQSALNWYQKQLDDLEKETKTIQGQIKEIEQSARQDEGDLASLETSIEEKRSQLANQNIDELQQQAAHWEKQIAVSRQALDNAQQALKVRQEQSNKTKTQRQTLIQRRDHLDEQIALIKSQVGKMRQSEGNVAEQIQEIQEQILPTETELKEAEVKSGGIEEEEAASRKTLNIAERQSAQTQIVFARRQEAFESLRQKIEDDFGLVEFKYEDEVSGPTPLPLGEMIERLPVVTELSPDIEDILKRYRRQLRRMGAINPEARREYDGVKERFEFLTTQTQDLEQAEKDITEVIAELDILMDREFRNTFDEVNTAFKDVFSRLFKGGSARLILTDENNLTESGVDIEARMPGKRMQRLALLSGGERSMTAVALIFALLKSSPTPFCVMDEVDAALDETNTDKLRELLLEFGEKTQFVIITHNRGMVQAANLIYGVTMGRDTTSQTISLKLDEVDERYSS